MMYKNRVWAVKTVASAEDLARLLTEHTWTLCTGFRLSGYLYLNDSTSEDGAQEYGVIKEATGKQVESITFSWCSRRKALDLIKRLSAGEFDDQAWDSGINLNQIESPERHRCHNCA